MKLLVITRADESVVEYTQLTHPIIRMFAEKWGAEFKILGAATEQKVDPKREFINKMWRILEFHDIFEDYDRIFHVDSDVVINKTCPNVFEIVPPDTIGLVFEDKGSRLRNRRGRIAEIKARFGGNEHWISGYFNMGIFLSSKMHRDMFTKIDGQLWKAKVGLEQTHLSYQLMKLKYKYIDLGYKFNHMSMFSEPWNGSVSRFDSHIIHYAGGAKFPDKGKRSRNQLIKDDIEKIYNE
jgi:lipopolysaccharide biosynthesis glycosyltransferase